MIPFVMIAELAAEGLLSAREATTVMNVVKEAKEAKHMLDAVHLMVGRQDLPADCDLPILWYNGKHLLLNSGLASMIPNFTPEVATELALTAFENPYFQTAGQSSSSLLQVYLFCLGQTLQRRFVSADLCLEQIVDAQVSKALQLLDPLYDALLIRKDFSVSDRNFMIALGLSDGDLASIMAMRSNSGIFSRVVLSYDSITSGRKPVFLTNLSCYIVLQGARSVASKGHGYITLSGGIPDKAASLNSSYLFKSVGLFKPQGTIDSSFTLHSDAAQSFENKMRKAKGEVMNTKKEWSPIHLTKMVEIEDDSPDAAQNKGINIEFVLQGAATDFTGRAARSVATKRQARIAAGKKLLLLKGGTRGK